MAEDQPAQRAGDEPDGVGGERQQGAGQWIEVGEEQLVEHQRGSGPVEEEVVPLQRGADETGRDDLARRAGGAVCHGCSPGRSPGPGEGDRTSYSIGTTARGAGPVPSDWTSHNGARLPVTTCPNTACVQVVATAGRIRGSTAACAGSSAG